MLWVYFGGSISNLGPRRVFRCIIIRGFFLACMVGVGMVLTTHLTTAHPLLTHRKGEKMEARL